MTDDAFFRGLGEGEARLSVGLDPELFRAVADPHRRAVLEAVVGGPLTLTELSRRLVRPRQLVVYHVGVLVEAGVLEARGHWVVARTDALRGLSVYFDRALLGVASAQAQMAVRKRGAVATDSSKRNQK